MNREHCIVGASRCVAVNPSDTAPALVALDAEMGFESHVIERIIEGDISINERAATVVLHGGLTVESGRLFVRPYAAFLAVENGCLIGGATLGLRF